jgi:predicted DNA-binding transcriptional regulator AlpA
MTYASTAIPHIAGFYRAQQITALLGIHKNTWFNWVNAGTVRGVKIPKGVLLSRTIRVWEKSEIHKMLEQLAALDDSPTPPEAA